MIAPQHDPWSHRGKPYEIDTDSDDTRDELIAFLDCVQRSDPETICPAGIGYENARTVLLGNQAMRDGAAATRPPGEQETGMTVRTRKLVGTVLLMLFLAIYALLALAAAIVLQVRDSKWLELAFDIVAGLAWVVPAGLLVKWMARSDDTVPPR